MAKIHYEIDRDFLFRTLTDLVKIDSTNPSLSASGKGEAEIASYTASVLNGMGLEVRSDELEPGRWNVSSMIEGRGNGKSLLLNAHLDTVGVEGMTIDPFGAEIREGRMYGRGTQDMKASLAAMLAVAKAFSEQGLSLAGNLYFTAVADEEHSSIGMEALVRQVKPDAAIVTEPTDLTICRAHRGFIWFEVETFGRAAHGSRFEEGIDANMNMGRFLSELDRLEKELRSRPPHPLAGPPSLHAARIRGGKEISVYAAHCLLQIERRTVPGETVEMAQAELQEIIDKISARQPDFKARLRPTFHREPFEVDREAGIVRVLEQTLPARIGEPPAHTGQTFWTDAALLGEAGVETVLLGPVGYGLHSDEEWVDLQSVEDLAHVLAETAIEFCSQAG